MAKIMFKEEKIYQTRKVLDEGLYNLRVVRFQQKWGKPKDGEKEHSSINFWPILEVLSKADGSPVPVQENGRPIEIWWPASTKFEAALVDFSHACGLPMETKTINGENYVNLPGIWYPEEQDDIEKCQYKGPIIGRKLQAYIVPGEYNNNPKNDIRNFICAIPNCASQFPKLVHRTNLIRKTE